MADNSFTYQATGGPSQSNIVGSIMGAVEALHTVIQLQDFTFRDVPGEPSTTKMYRWRTADGRTWRQDIDFAASVTDPAMSWPGDTFKLSEFIAHRDLRNACVMAYQVIGLTRCDWQAQ